MQVPNGSNLPSHDVSQMLKDIEQVITGKSATSKYIVISNNQIRFTSNRKLKSNLGTVINFINEKIRPQIDSGSENMEQRLQLGRIIKTLAKNYQDKHTRGFSGLRSFFKRLKSDYDLRYKNTLSEIQNTQKFLPEDPLKIFTPTVEQLGIGKDIPTKLVQKTHSYRGSISHSDQEKQIKENLKSENLSFFAQGHPPGSWFLEDYEDHHVDLSGVSKNDRKYIFHYVDDDGNLQKS